MDMITEIQNLMDSYTKWLADKTVLRQIEDWVEITTPYLDRHNDYLQIYVKRHNGGFLLTDDGYIVNDLLHSGCSLDSKKRKDLLAMTLNGFGVKLQNASLIVSATQNNFALKKHNLIQAMLAVNDLFYLSVPVITSLFIEDVATWMEQEEIRVLQNIKFTGASGYDHQFDFVIPKSRKYPDRMLRAINRPSRETTESYAWAWIDTREVRPESSAYAILNDSESAVSSSITTAFLNYDIKPILWSLHQEVIEDLIS
jgi:hypothetical protein